MTFKKEKIKNLIKFLKQSKVERKKWKETHKLIHIQQSSEKLYNAYIFMLEALEGVEIRYHKQSTIISGRWRAKDNDIWQLGSIVPLLHSFFYEGDEDGIVVDEWIKKSYKLFTKIRKKYNLY